jgi:hypothetical protein
MPFLVLGRYRPGRVQRRIAVCDRQGLSVVARERDLREFHTSRCRAVARGETAQPGYPGHVRAALNLARKTLMVGFPLLFFFYRGDAPGTSQSPVLGLL